MKKSFGQRQIPTLVGLAILVASLIGGIAMIGTGAGVFAPRAAPTTTPTNIKVTNVKDTSFTVSFITDEATAGFVKYGTEANTLKLQASDDRDQLTGNVRQFNTHYITVRDLQPNTTYYYTLGTGSNARFDNNGQPYSIKTAQGGGTPPNARTIYGTVNTAAGGPASGAIVYVTIPGAGELSSLTKESGSWAIALSSARTPDGTQYATINSSDEMTVTAQGNRPTETATTSLKVEAGQPVPSLTFGQSTTGAQTNSLTATTVTETSPTPAASGSANQTSQTEVATQMPLDTTATASSSATPNDTVDTTEDIHQTVTTTQPTFVGEAPPKTTISIQINSDSQINTTVTTDSSGNFSVDLEALKKELEPGEHTITISYTDPTTKQKVTETKTFTVLGATTENTDSSLLALASTSPKPFGSGNPVTISPTPTPSPTASVSARVAVPASASATPKSGSTTATLMLVVGGGVLLIAGLWSALRSRALLTSEVDPY